MARIGAHHANDALASNDAAMLAKFFTDALTFIKLAFQLPENDPSRHVCRREENRDFIACFQA